MCGICPLCLKQFSIALDSCNGICPCLWQSVEQQAAKLAMEQGALEHELSIHQISLLLCSLYFTSRKHHAQILWMVTACYNFMLFHLCWHSDCPGLCIHDQQVFQTHRLIQLWYKLKA
jgi:hypothetical protein